MVKLLNRLNCSTKNLRTIDDTIEKMWDSLDRIKIIKHTSESNVDDRKEKRIIDLSKKLKNLISMLSDVVSDYWDTIKTMIKIVSEINKAYAETIQIFNN